MDSAIPRRSRAHGVGIETLAPVADEDRHLSGFDLDEERDAGRTRPLGRVHRRLAAGGQKGP